MSEVLAATGFAFVAVPGERHMNIMGIGPQEMMIIAVIGLLVFGPGKLPEVMGQVGKFYRDFRRMSAELSGEFEKTIAEARDATAGITSELGSMTKEVSSVTNSVKKDLGVKSSTSSAKGKTTTGSKTSSTSKTTGGKTTSSTSKVGAKGSTSTTTSSASKASTAPATTATTAKKAIPVASREDPDADVSLFEPSPITRTRRSRQAVPSVIADPTPRGVDVFATGTPVEDEVLVSIAPVVDDAVSRARQRRRNAGYARNSA